MTDLTLYVRLLIEVLYLLIYEILTLCLNCYILGIVFNTQAINTHGMLIFVFLF